MFWLENHLSTLSYLSDSIIVCGTFWYSCLKLGSKFLDLCSLLVCYCVRSLFLAMCLCTTAEQVNFMEEETEWKVKWEEAEKKLETEITLKKEVSL